MTLNNCYRSTEWEKINADYNPVLNVIGIISLDSNTESFIGVYRTTDLSELSMKFSGEIDTIQFYDDENDSLVFELDSLYEPAGLIDSAVVIVFSELETFNFIFDSKSRQYKNNNFIPLENTKYSLIIDVNGFDLVTGDLMTPITTYLDTLLINDTLVSSNNYTLSWNNDQFIAEYAMLKGELKNSYKYCGGNFSSLVELSSQQFTVYPEWCDPESMTLGDIDNDYGIRTESSCLCGQYSVWDSENKVCICDDTNQSIWEDDEEYFTLYGGCIEAIEVLDGGCNHLLNDTHLWEYCPNACGGCEFLINTSENFCDEEFSTFCPESCGYCSSGDIIYNEDKLWSPIDFFFAINYLNLDLDSLKLDIGYCGDGFPDYENIEISLMVMDKNYYQYFSAQTFKEFSNFLFEDEGISGRSIGINGGFGVFGSFTSHSITRIVAP
tara:strand:+ start:1650 stop:2966 length:1317 start_codon:yes stop_codon:yes gene_type:complete